MKQEALSEVALRTGLIDIRLPPLVWSERAADALAALAFALVAALVVVLILRALSRRPRPTPAPSVDLAALGALPEAERRVALLHLLRAHAPERLADLGDTLYRPGDALDLAALEAEVARHV